MTIQDARSDQEAQSTHAREGQPASGTGRAIGSAAVVLMLGNLAGSVLGFIRQAVIGDVFGLGAGTNAFYAASIVPQMFYDLTIGAAISAALIPIFTETVERRGAEALWLLLGAVLALVWLILCAVMAILFVVARPFMLLVAGGLEPQTGGHVAEMAVAPLHVLIFTLFFLGTSAVLLSTLYSVRRFTVPAFAPSLYHLGVIGGAAFLARPLGILALPTGALVGSAAQAAVQLAAVLRLRPHIRLRLEITPEVGRIVRLYAPVTVGLLISVGGQIVDLHFKLHLRGGGLSAMQIATTLTQFPIGIAVAALSFAVLPSLSTEMAFDRMSGFKATLATGIRFVLFLTIPAAVGYIVLATPIVALLFQHGHHWNHTDTGNTALALSGYAVQIPFVGVDQLLIFAFYARKNTLTPMLVGVAGVGIYLGSALLLMPRFQILGLAVANTLQNSLHAVILLALLVLAIGPFGDRQLARSVATSAAAAAVMAGVLFACGLALHGEGLALRLAAVLVPIAAGGTAYLGIHALLHSSELAMLQSAVRARVERQRST